MKKIFILLAVLAVASCGSPKVTQTTTTTTTSVTTDLSKYESGLFDYGYSRSSNKGKAYTDALRNAQQNIATRLYRVVSAVDTDFAQDTENGAKLQSLSERSSRFVGIIDEKVIALGGVTFDKIPYLKRLNFGGVAMIGGLYNLETLDFLIKQE